MNCKSARLLNVNNSAFSRAHNAWLGYFILLVLANRMKSQCLLYLILEQESNAFWVVQAIDIGLVIILVTTVFRKPASMGMTQGENFCNHSNKKPHEEVLDPKTYFEIILRECVKRI